MGKAYVWNDVDKKFWIAGRVICLGDNIFLTMQHPVSRKEDCCILLSSARLVTEKFMLTHNQEALAKRIRNQIGVMTLPSGDQPSLLIED